MMLDNHYTLISHTNMSSGTNNIGVGMSCKSNNNIHSTPNMWHLRQGLRNVSSIASG